MTSSPVEVSCAVRPSEPFDRRFHHRDAAAGVQVAHVRIQGGKHRHAALHGVGDVVQFKVEEDLMSAPLDLTDHGGAFGVKQLHPYLDKRLPLLPVKLVEEGEDLLCGRKIQCDDDILAHDVHSAFTTPTISFKEFIPSSSMTSGSSSTMRLHA